VYTVESNVLCRRLISSYITANDLESRVIVLDKCATELTADDVQFNKVSNSIGDISFHGCFHNHHLWLWLGTLRWCVCLWINMLTVGITDGIDSCLHCHCVVVRCLLSTDVEKSWNLKREISTSGKRMMHVKSWRNLGI